MSERRWVRITLAIAIAGNLIGAGGAAYLLGSGSDDLTVEEAVRKFHEGNPAAKATPTVMPQGIPTTTPSATSTGAKAGGKKAKAPAAPPAADGRPAVGVYVFATEGYEETDALSGQRHDYPFETTMTVEEHECGQRWRWQPLAERWEESDGCETGAGYTLDRYAIYHEFFNQGLLETFDCDPDAVVRPATPVVGTSWHWKARSDDTSIDTLTTVMPFETLTIAGENVRAMHVRYETSMTGANEGSQVQDRWMDTETGMLVRMITAVDAHVDTPLGKAAYTERYRIDLLSLTPIS